MESFADDFEMPVRDQPVLLDHARCNQLETVRQQVLTGLQELVNVFGEIFKRFRGVLGPRGCEEVIVEDVDDDPAPMTVFWIQTVSASAGMEIGVGKGVDAPVKVQALCYSPGEVIGDRTLDKITHQTTELMLVAGAGQKKVHEIVQGQVLRILLCRIRISNAINALLASFWTLTTA